MIMDDYLEFADALASPTAIAKALLGDVVDSDIARNLGGDKALYLVIQVTEAFTSAGAATVQFILASDGGAVIAVDGSATEHLKTNDIPKATLVVGYQVAFALPPETPDYERYLGVLVEVKTATLTAGKVNAFLTMNPSAPKSYPDASN